LYGWQVDFLFVTCASEALRACRQLLLFSGHCATHQLGSIAALVQQCMPLLPTCWQSNVIDTVLQHVVMGDACKATIPAYGAQARA
jgi:hypothetical protein